MMAEPSTVETPVSSRSSGLVRAALLQKLSGYVHTQMIYLFAHLGIADHLTQARSCVELAYALGIGHDTFYRLARGWISAVLLTTGPNDTLAATPLAALLASDSPDSLREYALLAGEVWYPAWGGLAHLLDGKSTSFKAIFGRDYYSHLAHTGAGERFHRFMEARTVQTAQALLDSYDFSDARVVVDVGGGNGTLLQALLCTCPHLHGILFDQPATVCAAQRRPELAQLGQRCQFIGGDFFEAILPVGDRYILSQTLHNWSDDVCHQLLRNCRQSLDPQGRLLLIEQIIPEQIQANQPAVEADLMMLVLLGGRERSAVEYETMLRNTGFEISALIPLKRLGYSLIEARIGTDKRNEE